jgi:hypothetical protein
VGAGQPDRDHDAQEQQAGDGGDARQPDPVPEPALHDQPEGVPAAHPEHEQAGDPGPQLAGGPELADRAGAREHGQVDEPEHGDRRHGQRERRGQPVQHGRRADGQQGRDQQPPPA